MSEWDAVSMCVVKMVSMVIPGIGREFFFFRVSGFFFWISSVPFLPSRYESVGGGREEGRMYLVGIGKVSQYDDVR